MATNARLNATLILCSNAVSAAGLWAADGVRGVTSIFSSTVANVSPASFLRSGAGVIRLTPTSTAQQITNIKMA